MANFTPKIEMDTQDDSDAKKSYVNPDVVDLVIVDETTSKLPAFLEGGLVGPS